MKNKSQQTTRGGFSFMPDINFAAPTKPKNNTKHWIIVAILTLIPFVNIVMYGLWFGQKTSLYENTWKNASHYLLIIGLAISVVITIAVIALIVAAITGNGNPISSIVSATAPYQHTTGYPKSF